MISCEQPRIVVALDFPELAPALALVERIDPRLCRLKVGKEMFTRFGPELVRRLVDGGFQVFLDLKYHDIPNTVAAACGAAADLGVWMINVHALGGRRMMEAAGERLARLSHRPLLVAVTILTSLGEEDIQEVGLTGTPQSNVLRLAALAQSSGLDGVVCSPREAGAIREQSGDGFTLVTPGIRPRHAALNDQTRVMSPVEALNSGADYLVIGRPVTGADDPLGALEDIDSEIRAAGFA
jgi:orotidine-5'-phosphate decarboxylase